MWLDAFWSLLPFGLWRLRVGRLNLLVVPACSTKTVTMPQMESTRKGKDMKSPRLRFCFAKIFATFANAKQQFSPQTLTKDSVKKRNFEPRPWKEAESGTPRQWLISFGEMAAVSETHLSWTNAQTPRWLANDFTRPFEGWSCMFWPAGGMALAVASSPSGPAHSPCEARLNQTLWRQVKHSVIETFGGWTWSQSSQQCRV